MSNDFNVKTQENSDSQFDGNNTDNVKALQSILQTTENPNQVIRSLVGDTVYDFYFGEDNSKDVANLMSDCISKDKWGEFLDKFKNGEVSKDDMVDVVLLSHLHAVERANPVSSPEEIVDRAFESKLKGKLGRKLIANTISTLSEAKLLNAPEEAVQALLSFEINKSDARAEDQAKLLPAIGEQVKEAVDKSYESFLNSFNVYDNIRDITVEELLGRLDNQEDPYFGITHHIIFDMGWESISRNKPNEKCLSIYVCELDKAWTDSMESNVKQSDRHMTRYLVRDVQKGDIETINTIKNKIFEVYTNRIQEKIDFFNVIWNREN
jgi:hypothetical protein